MNKSNQHIIEKQFFHLQLSSQKDSFSLQQDMSNLFWEVISPAMEKLFDRFSTSDEVIVLEKLDIDLGTIAPENLKKVLVQKLVFALEEALNKAIILDTKNVQKLPLKQRHFDQWIYFLETGVMPVRSAYTEETVFQQAVLDTLGLNRGAVQQLQEMVQQHPQAFRRLLLQHSTSFLKTIIELFSGINQTELLDVLPVLTKVWTQAGFSIKDLSNLDLPALNSPSLPLYFWAFILKESIFKYKKQTPKIWIEQLILSALSQKKQAKLLPVLKKEIAQKNQIQSFFAPIIKQIEKSINEVQNSPISSTAESAAMADDDKPSIADTIALQKEQDSPIFNPEIAPVFEKDKTNKPDLQSKPNKPEEEKEILKDKKTPKTLTDKTQYKAEQADLSEDKTTEEKAASESPFSRTSKQEKSPTAEQTETATSLNKQQKSATIKPTIADINSEAELGLSEPKNKTKDIFIKEKKEENPTSKSLSSKTTKQEINPTTEQAETTKPLDTQQENTVEKTPITDENSESKSDLFEPENKEKSIFIKEKQEEKPADSESEKSNDSLAPHPPPHEFATQEKNPKIDSNSLVQKQPTDTPPKAPTKKEASSSSNLKSEKEASNLAKVPKPPSRKTTKPPSAPKVGSSFYVTHAGLVLVHAFLPHLFKHLKLVDGKAFVDDNAQEKAIHIIHYLATGNIKPPEYELLLPKFLCQMPFHQAIARDILLSEEEKEEANNLLKAAIKHWGKLGNASPDALREGFFQRDGKLTKKEQGWYLQVEEKSLDILLDFLPWGISMIRLPWMKELLRVEWGK